MRNIKEIVSKDKEVFTQIHEKSRGSLQTLDWFQDKCFEDGELKPYNEVWHRLEDEMHAIQSRRANIEEIINGRKDKSLVIPNSLKMDRARFIGQANTIDKLMIVVDIEREEQAE